MRKAKDLWRFLILILALLFLQVNKFVISLISYYHGAKAGKWCIAKPSTGNVRLNQNIDYSCQQKGVDCGSCFVPNTAISRASYVMNLYYKAAGKHSWNCHFSGTGMIISQVPSYGACHYPM
ncbi:hypothetical protein K2173_008081 [Erythroxylum novogranatense]|uniref:X8 domain-containing protein n=1 Tax=Erythroxylum novogranatense TaxID=1862640 RepID=A0AAV8S9A6_9ROSI|nr:hypothetical protein K2173_008081 [Erythroxylum novogranatense]